MMTCFVSWRCASSSITDGWSDCQADTVTSFTGLISKYCFNSERDAHLQLTDCNDFETQNIKSHNNCTPARTLLSKRSQNSGQKSQWDSLRFVYTEKPIVDDAGRRRPASSILARMLEGRQCISTSLSKHTAHRHEHVSPFISPYEYGYKWQSGKRKSHGMQYTWWR
jgi:hypothetical protein